MKINEYDLDFSNRLRECLYAGDIRLSESELKDISVQYEIGYDEIQKNVENFYSITLVIAVNCAYHYYDDQGFWEHFFELIGKKNDAETQRYFGDLIEKALKFYRLFTGAREGSYRYVGAILEQTGITKRYFDKFLNIFSSLKNRFGIAGLVNVSRDKFNRNLRDFPCPKYLSNYLFEESGWKYVRQVASLVNLFESGEIDKADLYDFKGFRPEFWETLISNTGIVSRSFDIHSNRYLHKNLIFEPKYGKPVYRIYFDGVPDSAHYELIDYHGNFRVISPRKFTVGSCPMIIQDKDNITYIYRFAQWIPSGNPVLLDIVTGLIPQGSEIYIGSYYLFSTEEQVIGSTISFGIMDIDCVSYKYYCHRIDVSEASEIPGYSVIATGSQNFKIDWVDKQKFLAPEFTCDGYDVFIYNFPSVFISNWSLIRDQSVVVTFSVGKNQGRITCQEDLNYLQELVKQSLPAVCSIKSKVTTREPIWFEGAIPPELLFVVLPSGCVSIEQEYCVPGKSVQILIRGLRSSDIFLGPSGDVTRNEKGFLISPSENSLSGNILIAGIKVRFSLPIIRLGAYVSASKDQLVHQKYVCLDDPAFPNDILFYGLYSEDCRLYIGESYVQNLHFDSNGKAQVKKSALEASLNSSRIFAQELRLNTGDGYIDLNTFVIDYTEMVKSISQEHEDLYCCYSQSCIPELTEVLKLIIEGKQLFLFLSAMPRMCQYIDTQFAELLAAAESVNSIVIEIDGIPKSFITQERTGRKWQEILVRRINKYSHKNAPLVEFSESLLDEWNSAVLHNYLPSDSPLKNIPGVDSLTVSWKAYRQNRLNISLKYLELTISYHSLVTQYRDFLHTWILVKCNRLVSAMEILNDADWNAMVETKQLLTDICRGLLENEFVLRAGKECLTELCLLPLTDEDIGTVVSIIQSDRHDINLDCSSWITLAVLLKTSGLDRTRRAIIRKRLLETRAEIPTSTEGFQIN